MVAANPNLAAAASARVAAAKAMKAEADAAAAQGRAEMVAMRVERAKNPPPKSSRPRKGKTEPANPAYVDRGGSFDELDIIPTGKVFPGKRFDEPDLGAVDPGTVVGKKVPPGTGQAIPFPGSRVAESASAPRDLVPEYKGARLYRSPFPVVKRPEEASAFMGAPGTPTRIPIDSLSTSQGDMTISKVDNLAASPASGDLPLVFKQGDRYIIDDGNNRLAAAWKRGDTSVNVRIVELPSPAATAGDDLLALLGQSKARLDAGESIGALNAEARAAKPSAITPLHEAMAEIDPKARVVVDAVRNQERSADAIRRRFTIRDAGGTHRVALPDLEAMTIGRIKQAYKDATEIEKAAILETIGPQKAKALTDIVEGRARFDKWYKNKAHVYEDGSYNPAEAFPITRTDLEMRMPAGDAPVYDAPPNLDEPDFDLGAPSNAVEGAEAISANRAAAEISDFERSHAALADVLGPNAPPEAVELSKGVTKALAEQERKAVARMAMSADDAGRAAQMVSLPGAAGLAAAPAKRSGLLGVVGDFAAANEALQAIGIQTPFDVDKIPVVGPLLGVWAKWRAATTVLGKAGFRVPFSGETRIAGAASKTRDAMADAVDRLLARGAKAAAKTRPIAPALAWRAVDVIGDRLFDDGKRRKAETMADAMRARSEELQAAMANPAAVRSMVRDAMRDVRDPDLVDATVAVAMRKIEYLAKHAPQPPTPDMLSRSTWRPSPTDVERFARRVRAANHPIGVLEDVAAGRVTAEAAETLREVYPRLYLEAQERLIERSAELNEDLPHALVVRLSILFAVPLVRSLEPAHMAAIQAAGAPKQPAPAPPMGGVMQPPPAGAPNVSDLYMTADQRRSR